MREKALCWVLASCGWALGADLVLETENLSSKNPGDAVQVEAIVQGMISAKVKVNGGWVWEGGMAECDKASFATSVPKNFIGNHNSKFGGEYAGEGGTGNRKLEWEKSVTYQNNGEWVKIEKPVELTNTKAKWTYAFSVNYNKNKWSGTPVFSFMGEGFKPGEPVDYPVDLKEFMFPGKIQIGKKENKTFLVPPASPAREFKFTIKAKCDEVKKQDSVTITVKNKKPELSVKCAQDHGNYVIMPISDKIELDIVKFRDLEEGRPVGCPETIVRQGEVTVHSFVSAKIENGVINKFRFKKGRKFVKKKFDEGTPKQGWPHTSDNFVVVKSKFAEEENEWTIFVNVYNIENLLKLGHVKFRYSILTKDLSRIKDEAKLPVELSKNISAQREFWILKENTEVVSK